MEDLSKEAMVEVPLDTEGEEKLMQEEVEA